MENQYGDIMNIVEAAEQLKTKFGTHAEVARLLMIKPLSYYAVRTGRANPSKRLLRDMKNLLDKAGE